MKTKEELIKYYEKQLEKVVGAYGNDSRKEDYINHAKGNLEAVINGRGW
ncbi:hypothetical protein MHB54_00910 [Paenibacillus sp. FSL M7-0802]|jgi:hypothetical protein